MLINKSCIKTVELIEHNSLSVPYSIRITGVDDNILTEINAKRDTAPQEVSEVFERVEQDLNKNIQFVNINYTL